MFYFTCDRSFKNDSSLRKRFSCYRSRPCSGSIVVQSRYIWRLLTISLINRDISDDHSDVVVSSCKPNARTHVDYRPRNSWVVALSHQLKAGVRITVRRKWQTDEHGFKVLFSAVSFIHSFISLISASDKTHSLLQLVRKQVTVHV